MYTPRQPHQRALHLRWLDDELYQRIYKAAKYRNQTLTHWVAEVLKLYLDGGVSRYVGTCSVCQKRAALSAPVKVRDKVRKMEEEAQVREKMKTEENVRTCRHALARHPGCMKADLSGHAHGPWWPRAECDECGGDE